MLIILTGGDNAVWHVDWGRVNMATADKVDVEFVSKILRTIYVSKQLRFERSDLLNIQIFY
jgi:hypothetical protein